MSNAGPPSDPPPDVSAHPDAPVRPDGWPRGLRRATPDDVPALVALVESAYRGSGSRQGWTTEAHLLRGQRVDGAMVTEAVTGADSVVLVVAADGPPDACCQLERRDGYAYFGMFAVRPAAQGGGLGRALLAAAERYAGDRWNAGEVRMTVLTQRQDLIGWYVRRGYTRTDETLPFPYGDERFGVPMRDDLAFEVLVKKLVG